MSYDIGNTAKYKSLARDIIEYTGYGYDSKTEDEIAAWANSKDPWDIRAAKAALDADADSIRSVVHTLTREGGLIDRLKTCIDFDISLFDEYNEDYQHEIRKILYFFYTLEHKNFKSISKELKIHRTGKMKGKEREYFNILDFLKNPTIESIDYSAHDLATFNGKITKYIKDFLEAELPLIKQDKIVHYVQMISGTWDDFLRSTIFRIDLLGWQGHEFEKIIESHLLQPAPESEYKIYADKDKAYTLSPTETLYLKILQFEHLCTMIDVSKIDENNNETNYNVSSEFIKEFRMLSCEPIKDIEKYISENAPKLARLVWYNEKTDGEKNRTIKRYTEKVQNWVKFCIWARIITDVEDSITEMLIVSCLQAFIVDKDLDFKDYNFHLSQLYMKHLPTDQSVLTYEGFAPIPSAKQVYWVHRVLDRLYANAGMYGIRKKLRGYVNNCYESIKVIFSCPNLDEMLEVHKHYFNYFKMASDNLISLRKKSIGLLYFEQFLHDKGFQFVDIKDDIYYIFAFSVETEYIYQALVSYVDVALIYKKDKLHLQISEADEKTRLPFQISVVPDTAGARSPVVATKEVVVFDFEFLFDYQSKICTFSNFKIPFI